MKQFILSIDQGTTGSTALIIDASSFELVSKHNEEFKQIFPKPGLVEHDLNDIWKSIKVSVTKAIEIANISGDQIKCIGITNQRETTCSFDKSANPLANAIVWQDRRTADFCQDKKIQYSQRNFDKTTGLPLDPYFSATKMAWLLNNNEKVKNAAENKNLLFGTIDTYLLYKMSNGTSFKTEASNASRTLLMDLATSNWSNELLNFFEIPKETLPTIENSFCEFGKTQGLDFLPDNIPISCMLGDQQAALFGQAGYKEGSLKCTYGTGAFILLNTGKNKTYSKHGLLTTVAYKHNNEVIYALEGSSFIAGAAVQWLRDNLGIIENGPQVEELSLKVSDMQEMEHLMFFPFFTGIGSPYWEPNAKGAIIGITRDTENKHIARACLEGIALAINDSINSLVSDVTSKVESIKVDGGACANDLLMQIQANFSYKKIIRPKIIETTAYGVALGAMIGLDQLKFEQIDSLWKEDKTFEVNTNEYFQKKLNQWNEKIKKIYL